jgi:hypothetical protein
MSGKTATVMPASVDPKCSPSTSAEKIAGSRNSPKYSILVVWHIVFCGEPD